MRCFIYDSSYTGSGGEKIRSRDVQMTAIAFLETRTILVSGTLQTSDQAIHGHL